MRRRRRWKRQRSGSDGPRRRAPAVGTMGTCQPDGRQPTEPPPPRAAGGRPLGPPPPPSLWLPSASRAHRWGRHAGRGRALQDANGPQTRPGTSRGSVTREAPTSTPGRGATRRRRYRHRPGLGVECRASAGVGRVLPRICRCRHRRRLDAAGALSVLHKISRWSGSAPAGPRGAAPRRSRRARAVQPRTRPTRAAVIRKTHPYLKLNVDVKLNDSA